MASPTSPTTETAGALDAAPPAGQRLRRVLVVGVLIVVAGVAAVAIFDPFAKSASPRGVTDNAYPTSLATVTRQNLSSQTQVSATLAYKGSATILVPSGTSPSAVAQAQQSLAHDQEALGKDRASLSADGQTLTEAQASVAAARARQSVDCAGDGAAESDSSTGSGGLSPCASAAQALTTAQQSIPSAQSKLTSDREALSSAERALAGAKVSLSSARSTEVFYGQGAVFTSLPSAGQVIRRGQVLYEATGQRVVLMYGPLLATRAFLTGMSPGRDVGELNANLRALGFGHGLAGDTFTSATEAAIRAFQSAHDMQVTGQLPLGAVVFQPGAVRVTSVTPQVGSMLSAGPLLSVSSTARQVVIALEAAEQSYVKVGDPVTITLPDNHTTPGRVSYVASVARAGSSGSESSSGSSGSSSSPTIEVDVTPSDPGATGHLDQAPVEVSITTASEQGVLTVPVDALLARSSGNYSVEEVTSSGTHHLVPVSLGLFDDAAGLVGVSGTGLAAGQRVVVPGE